MLASDLKIGKIFKENGQPYLVVKYEHMKTARGGATTRVKAKNLINGNVIEYSRGSTEKVEEADVVKKSASYLFKEANNYVFMDPETYEQIYISQDIVADQAPFFIEGEKVLVMYFEDTPVSVEIPNNLAFEVTYTEPSSKGNTVTNAFKNSTISNGLSVKVPLFIKMGDIIKVDTRTREYVSKA
jgi:elongation factor P